MTKWLTYSLVLLGLMACDSETSDKVNNEVKEHIAQQAEVQTYLDVFQDKPGQNILEKYYPYNTRLKCHLLQQVYSGGEEEAYCMTLDKEIFFDTDGPQNLFIIIAGEKVDLNTGEKLNFHVHSGLAGLFYLVKKNNEWRLQSMEIGRFVGGWGSALNNVWKIKKFGPDVYGLVTEDGYTGQGYTSGDYKIFLPFKETFSMSYIGNVKDSMGACLEDNESLCKTTQDELKAELLIDPNHIENDMYQLKMIVNGHLANKQYNHVEFIASINKQEFIFEEPKNYPVSGPY